jgi:hypothetical protein
MAQPARPELLIKPLNANSCPASPLETDSGNAWGWGFAKNSIAPEFEGRTVGGRLHVCPRGDAVADLPGSIGIGLPPRLFARLCAPRIARSAQVLFECIACGGDMACEVAELGEFVCAVLGAISPFKAQVLQRWDAFVVAFLAFCKLIQPHLQYIGPLFGFVMFVWRWWDKRDEVLFRRLEALLLKDGKATRVAGQATIARLTRPSAHPATETTLAELKKIFVRTKLRPRYAVARRTGQILDGAVQELDRLDRVAALQAANRQEQRFAARAIQGVISSARHKPANAVGYFEQALDVQGRKDELQILEFVAQQNFIRGHSAEAAQQFDRIITLLREKLLRQPDQSIRHGYNVQLLRVTRQKSLLQHKANANTIANSTMVSITGDPLLQVQLLQLSNPAPADLAERALFHELHGCARAIAFGLAPGNVTDVSLLDAERDYRALSFRLESKSAHWIVRMWRWLTRRDAKDGTQHLRNLATSGLRRVEVIRTAPDGAACRH